MKTTYDKLTGLPGRIIYEDRLSQQIALAKRRGTSLIMAVWDIFAFGALNEKYGAEKCDSLLCKIADRMLLSLRESDTLARLERDEFVMLLSCARGEEDDCIRCAVLRAFKCFAEPFSLGEGITVTAKINCGIALYPRHSQNGEDLYMTAEKALQTSKTFGESQCFIWDTEGPLTFDKSN